MDDYGGRWDRDSFVFTAPLQVFEDKEAFVASTDAFDTKRSQLTQIILDQGRILIHLIGYVVSTGVVLQQIAD